MKKTVLILLAMLTTLPALAFYFQHEDNTVYYEIIDEVAKTVEVSRRYQNASWSLIIPSKVRDNNNIEYTVI